MTTRERLFLTPVEKCLKYGVVPWKLMLNVLLIILVTVQVGWPARRKPAPAASHSASAAIATLPISAPPWPQVIVINSQESNYVQAAAANLFYFFYPADYDFSQCVSGSAVA